MPADYTGFKENGLDIADKYVSVSDANLIEDDLTVEGRQLYLTGGVYTMGRNLEGQIGDGTIIYKSSPVQVGSDVNWKQTTAGIDYVLSLKTDGTLWSWGNNAFGTLGIGFTPSKVSTPVQVGSDTFWKTVVAGGGHGLGIRQDGSLWVWGNNANLAYGFPSASSGSPLQIYSDTDWKQIAGTYNGSHAIKNDGTLWGWGYNANGEAGTGISDTQVSTPVQVGAETNWKHLSAFANNAFAIKNDGTLWGWGANTSYQLGTVTNVDQSSPVQLGTDTNWVTVANGGNHMLAINTTGELWGQGSGASGKLGNGSTAIMSTMIQIGTLTDWLSVRCGSDYSLAVKTDGTLWGWGQNGNGQLGLDDITNRSSPVQIGVFNDWKTCSGGQFFTTVLR